MHKRQLLIALLRRRTEWTAATTATPSDKALRAFERKGGYMAAVHSGYREAPEEVVEELACYGEWLEELLARIVAKACEARVFPPAGRLTHHEMCLRNMRASYLEALARVAEKELKFTRGAVAACQEIIDTDRPMDEWHALDDAGQVVNLSYRPRV